MQTQLHLSADNTQLRHPPPPTAAVRCIQEIQTVRLSNLCELIPTCQSFQVLLPQGRGENYLFFKQKVQHGGVYRLER